MKKIIIIGGGIVGASFAYHASLYNSNKITILADALPGDSKQATSNTWGWINGYSNNDKDYADFRLANLDYWPKLLEEVKNFKYTSKGAFFWDMDDENLNKTIDQHNSWGHRVKKISQLQMSEIVPELNELPIIAGFGENDLALDGSHIASKLIENSGCEIKKIKVSGLTCKKDHVMGVKTEKGILNADEIIIAAGLGVTDLLSSININFEMKSSLGLLAYTKPLPLLLKHPITGKDFHVRQDDQGRLVIGGKFDEDLSKERNTKQAAENLVQEVSAKLNYNDKITLDYFTLGLRPLPIDGRPKIGRLMNNSGKEIKGVYLAVMHSGVTNAPLAGKLGMQEIISGVRHPLISNFITQKTIDNDS